MELVVIAVLLLSICLIVSWNKIERFTAPGLTLTVPPSWFPQNSAKAYSEKDWKSPMYLDRYPSHDLNGDLLSEDEFLKQVKKSSEHNNYVASAYRLWRM